MGELRLFHHLYRQDRVVNARSREDHPLDASNYEPFARSTGTIEEAAPRLAQLPVPAFEAFGDAWDDGFASMRNLLLQLHSLQAVTQALQHWEPDLVVFARPDLVYHDAIPEAEIECVLADPNRIAVPAWQWWSGVNDRFAICGRGMARTYGERIALATEFCERNRAPLQSEQLLRFCLMLSRARISPIDLRASRVRADGRMESESFEPSSPALVFREALRRQAETGRRGP